LDKCDVSNHNIYMCIVHACVTINVNFNKEYRCTKIR